MSNAGQDGKGGRGPEKSHQRGDSTKVEMSQRKVGGDKRKGVVSGRGERRKLKSSKKKKKSKFLIQRGGGSILGGGGERGSWGKGSSK